MLMAVWDHFSTDVSSFLSFFFRLLRIYAELPSCWLWMVGCWSRSTALFLGCYNHFPVKFLIYNWLKKKKKRKRKCVSISTRIVMLSSFDKSGAHLGLLNCYSRSMFILGIYLIYSCIVFLFFLFSQIFLDYMQSSFGLF